MQLAAAAGGERKRERERERERGEEEKEETAAITAALNGIYFSSGHYAKEIQLFLILSFSDLCAALWEPGFYLKYPC